MHESISEVQKSLDDTARECMRYISTQDLKPEHLKRLAKFMFGCMNQKHELPRRVRERGSGEFDKVLRFINKVCEVLLEIDQEQNSKGKT